MIDSGIGATDATGHGSAVGAILRRAAGAGVRIVSYPDLNRAGFAQPPLMAQAIRRAAADGVPVVNISQTIAGRAPSLLWAYPGWTVSRLPVSRLRQAIVSSFPAPPYPRGDG